MSLSTEEDSSMVCRKYGTSAFLGMNDEIIYTVRTLFKTSLFKTMLFRNLNNVVQNRKISA